MKTCCCCKQWNVTNYLFMIHRYTLGLSKLFLCGENLGSKEQLLPTWYPTQSTAQFAKTCRRSSNFFTTIHFWFCDASGTMSPVLQLLCKDNKNTENSVELYQDKTCSHKHYLHPLTHSLTCTTQHRLRLCKSCSWWAMHVCCFVIITHRLNTAAPAFLAFSIYESFSSKVFATFLLNAWKCHYLVIQQLQLTEFFF